MADQPYLQKSQTREPAPIQASIFVQDPMFAREHAVGIRKIKLPGEPWLGAGPTSSRIQVVDQDDETGKTHPPVGVLANGTGFKVGRGKPASNFKFHQVNVWATMSRVLNHLESSKVYGRRIPWAFPGGRLLVQPHAGVDKNAFYDREMGAICFFYFDGPDGQTIYTCLSHDVVAHELGHAVLDGLKPFYNEVDSPDVAGFHEYFGDALAMTSALTMGEVVARVVGNAPKTLNGHNLVADIAREFGSALGGEEPFLRSAENRVTMAKLKGKFEEHDYSLVLTGAFYDLLQKIYPGELRNQQKKADNRKPGQLAVAALINAANYTSRMMLRGVDYCPPAGLTYREYARAVIRADEVAYPVDERNYREMAAEVFVKRGIVKSHKQLAQQRSLQNDDLRPYDIEDLAASVTDAYIFVDRNRELLGIPRDQNFHVTRLFETHKTAAAGYYPPREIVIEFVWNEDVQLTGSGFGSLTGATYTMYCGGSLVFDTNGNVLHYALADCSQTRQRAFRSYLRYLVDDEFVGGEEENELHSRRIRSTVANGRLQLTRNPALRHEGRWQRQRGKAE